MKLFIMPAIFILLFASPLLGEQLHSMKAGLVIIRYDKELTGAALEIREFLPYVKSKIEEKLNFPVDFKFEIVLIRDHSRFYELTKTHLISAFAVPERYFFVIDCSRMKQHPLNLKLLVLHELTHLVLHHYSKDNKLPKWLNEGVAQWVSDGLHEIVSDQSGNLLRNASLSGGVMKLSQIEDSFPSHRFALLLAYEQSLSIVKFMEKRYGKDRIQQVLSNIAENRTIDLAIKNSLSCGIDELEDEWRKSLNSKTAWILFISDNFIWILFCLGGVLMTYGYIRVRIKMRNYRDDEFDEEDFDE